MSTMGIDPKDESQIKRLEDVPVTDYSVYREYGYFDVDCDSAESYLRAGARLPDRLAKKLGFKQIEKEQADEIRDKAVRAMARLGCSDAEITAALGMSPSGLRTEKWRAVLEEARAELKASLRRKQLEVALKDGDPGMLKFLGMQLLGQSTKEKVVQSVNLSSLSDSDLDRLERALQTRDPGEVDGLTAEGELYGE